MGLPVVTVAAGGLPIVESTVGGTPVTEATNGRGVPVTKVVGKPGLPVVFETIGVVLGVPITLDGTPLTVTMSNGNLTATRSNTSIVAAGARSTFSTNVGKAYFEVTVGVHNGVNDAIGVVGPATTYATALTGQGGLIIFLGGNIWTNNAATGKSIGAVVAGNVVGIAIDWGPGAPTPSLSWVRRNNGLWNGDVAANPVTGANGIAGSGIGLAGNPMLLFGSTGSATGDTMTANFGQSAYGNAAPAGFGNWTLP